MYLTEVLFWAATVVLTYTLVGFPLLLWVRAKLRPRPIRSLPETPTVSLIVAAHNEEEVIAEKLRNIGELDYPSDRLQVIIASDGSTDGTCDIIRGFGGQRKLLALPRVGKAAAMNSAVAEATGDILVFTDANSLFARRAIRELVAPFADPGIGGVAGDQRYTQRGDGISSASDGGERAYWNLDRYMKCWESRGGNIVSATGAIYAIRRDLFRQIPEGVTDDFATSTAVIVQGFRLVFAPDACSYEPVASDERGEFNRKVRIMTRGLRAVCLRRQLLNPLRHGFYSLQLFSHKVLRRLMVLPLAVMLLSSALLATSDTLYASLFSLQIAFYLVAAAGWLLRRRLPKRFRIALLPTYFCLVNLAALTALGHLLTGRSIRRWSPQRGSGRAIGSQ